MDAAFCIFGGMNVLLECIKVFFLIVFAMRYCNNLYIARTLDEYCGGEVGFNMSGRLRVGGCYIFGRLYASNA